MYVSASWLSLLSVIVTFKRHLPPVMRIDGQHQVWAAHWGYEEWRAVGKSRAGWQRQHQPPANTDGFSENSRAFELRLLFNVNLYF